MKQNILTFSLITLLFLSCEKEKKIIKVDKLSIFPTVVDTVGVDNKSIFDEENPTWLSTAFYQLYFIGELKDSIYLKPSLSLVEFPPPITKEAKEVVISKTKDPLEKYFIDLTKENKHKYWSQAKVEIQLKTSVKIDNSYPVLIRNINKDTITIAYGSQIALIMEAKDSLGKWKPIQEKFTYMCGNGVGTIILPPNEIIITLAPIFKGDFKTQLRLSLGENKSNAFWGSINYRQFKSKFDENGNYDLEYENEMSNDKTTNR